MFKRRAAFAGLAILALAFSAQLCAQTTSLTFEPVNSAYSTALDRIVLISSNPNVLHIYNPASNTDTAVVLADIPLNLSLSPDGLHAAVAHSASVSYVDLSAGTIEKTFAAAVGTGVVILSPQYVYVFPSYEGSILSIDISTAQTTTDTFVYVSGGRYNAALNTIYSTEDGLSPNDVYRYDASAGPITTSSKTGPYWGTFPICGPLWFSPDGSRIYTACGTVFHASSDSTVDMTYVSTFPGLNQIQSLSTSATLSQIAAIPKHEATFNSTPPTQNDNEVRLYDSAYLNQLGRFELTAFSVGANNYQSHGKQVFFNTASTKMYVLMQADGTSGLVNDYAMQTIPLQNAPSCVATFGIATAAAAATGEISSAAITADASCNYTAVSNASWLELISGSFGSGNNNLSYIVRPNSGSQRTGTISLGANTLTITQGAVSASSPLNPLSYKIAGADYAKPLDKIVFVTAAPNELHLYDPVTQADQIVPLVAAALAVSVAPDGSHAAVGHNGWISYVNLGTPAVEKVIPMAGPISALTLAGNGYLYTIIADTLGGSGFVSYNLATGTATSGSNDATVLRLTPDDNYLYGMSQYLEFLKWDISGGVASSISEAFNTAASVSNMWISQDGTRLFTSGATVLRLSTEPSLDLTPNGSFSGTSLVQWAADSSAQQSIAVLTAASGLSGNDTTLQLYGDNGLPLNSQVTLPGFEVAGAYFTGHGKYVFWNSAATKLFVVEEADSTANLTSDFGVLTLDQAINPSNCTFSVSGSPGHIGGGGGAISLSGTAPAGCHWASYAAGASWLTLSASSAGSGSGTVTVYASPNTNYQSTRSATFMVAGQPVMVNQDAPCTYSVTPSTMGFYSGGGNGSILVTTGSDCSWTATSSSSWLTVSSGASGSGDGIVSFSVPPDTTGTGQTASINITGAGFSYSSTSANVYQDSTPPPVATALRFVSAIPCRIVDTRGTDGAFGGPIVSGGTTRNFQVPSSTCNILSNAQAYSLNVTVVPTGVLGFLTLWPSGEPQPLASTLNSDGRVKAAAAVVPAGISGGVSVYASQDSHVILDINGYYVPASTPNALAFYPATPCRISDTRWANGPLGGPTIAGGVTRNVPVQRACNIPSSAQAYSLNLTVVPKGALGYLSSWPAGQAQPLVSTLNAPYEAVTANAATVVAGTAGNVSIYASDAGDVIMDINGYYAPPTGTALSLYPVTPCRIVDTRSSPGFGKPVVGTTNFNVTGSSCGIPSAAQEIVLNMTVVPTGELSYVTIWPNGQSQPLASTLNAQDGAVTSNLAITPTTNGLVSVYTTNPTHVILDISGYFAP